MNERRITTMSGVERVVNGAAIDKFASQLRGVLLASDDVGYDAVRKVWNGTVNKRRALIARCTGAGASALRVNTTFSFRFAGAAIASLDERYVRMVL